MNRKLIQKDVNKKNDKNQLLAQMAKEIANNPTGITVDEAFNSAKRKILTRSNTKDRQRLEENLNREDLTKRDIQIMKDNLNIK